MERAWIADLEEVSEKPCPDLQTKMRVLIVEDHEDTAQTMATILRFFGYETVVVMDGSSALVESERQQPDVVLLDIGLPGMDGYEAARQLRARVTAKKPFIIAITGYGREEDQQKSQEAGIDLHLVKPADPKKLETLLARLSEIVVKVS